MEKGKGLASYPGNAQNMGIKLVEGGGNMWCGEGGQWEGRAEMREEGKRSLRRGEREREA